MNTTKYIITTLLLCVIGVTEIAVAHDLPGALGRKKSKAAATDTYNVSCFNDGNGEPDHLFVEVFDRKPRNPARISAQIFVPSTGAATAPSIDPVDGDARPSPGLELVGGVGPYQVNIAKTRSRKRGSEIYFVIFHCESSAGVHTGTDEPELTKNQ